MKDLLIPRPLEVLCFVAVAVVMLVTNPLAAVVKADIDTPLAKTVEGAVSRNVVNGQVMKVCSVDYPNGTEEAIDGWNEALNPSSPSADRYVRTSPFRFYATYTNCPTLTDAQRAASQQIESIRVVGNPDIPKSSFDALPPGVPARRCHNSDGTAKKGCFWHTYDTRQNVERGFSYTIYGQPIAYISETDYPTTVDGGDQTKLPFHKLQVTLMHELGHAFGIEHHGFPDTNCDAGEQGIFWRGASDENSACSVLYSNGLPRVTQNDLDAFVAIYHPNTPNKAYQNPFDPTSQIP